MTTIRAASLSGLGAVVHRLGCDEGTLFLRAGLSPQQLADPEARVSLKAVCWLLHELAKDSGRDDVGLLMASQRRVSNLGTLGLMSVLQADLRQALDVAISRRRDICSGLALHLEEGGGIAVLSFDLVAPGAPSVRQAIEQTAGVLVQLARCFLGPDWTPRRVCFRHPPPLDLRGHRALLGWSVEFEHDFNALVLSSAELSARAPLNDPLLGDLARRHIMSPTTRPSVQDACREQVLAVLAHGVVSVDLVAQNMGMQRRTLQRRLAADGVSFSDVVQQVRIQLVGEYLACPHYDLATVASLLGFSCPSAFARWHRTQFGLPARARRRSRTGG